MKIKPQIFISYSWSSEEHKDWVRKLAEKLTGDGVIVHVDIWDLKEGHDKYTFMERMVKSDDICKVLIVVDRKYSEKANQRIGGVGEETQIISPEIYKNVKQEKFIPIVCEKDSKGEAYLPVYLQSRIYIDFSTDELYKQSYDNLIRSIYNKPKFIRPKLGNLPEHLNNDSGTEKAKMDLIELIGAIIGVELAEQLLSKPNQYINVMLNSNTIEELKLFEKKGWVSLKPTFSTTASMGGNNNNGNSIEDRKRPYGSGAGFILGSHFDIHE